MIMLFIVQSSNTERPHKIDRENHLQSLQRQLVLTVSYIVSFLFLMLYICGLLHWESSPFSKTDEDQMTLERVTSI